MSLFFPRGVMPGDVPDPDALAEEYREAARIAGHTTHYQWKLGTVADYLNLAMEKLVNRESKTESAVLQVDAGVSDPILPDMGGASTTLWKIPYNRGWSVVGTGITDGEMTVEWTSDYDEMLWILTSFQYIRESIIYSIWGGTFFGTEQDGQNKRMVRMQSGIDLDGHVWEGSGPFSLPTFMGYAGLGISQKAAGIVAMVTTVVPAGSHACSLIAAQAAAVNVRVDGGEPETYAQDAPVDRVCIGNRELHVFRFARGALMRQG